VFKVSAFRLNTCVQTGAPLSDSRINNTLVTFTVTSRWERCYTVKAVHVVDNSGSTSHSIISCHGQEIFVQISRIFTKFCPQKSEVPVIMTHRVVLISSVRAAKLTPRGTAPELLVRSWRWCWDAGQICIRRLLLKILRLIITVLPPDLLHINSTVLTLSVSNGLTVLVCFYFPAVVTSLLLHHPCISMTKKPDVLGMTSEDGWFLSVIMWDLLSSHKKCCVTHLPRSVTPSVIPRTVWPRRYLGQDRLI